MTLVDADDGANTEAKAQHDRIRQLNAALAERDVVVEQLMKKLERSQAQVRSRDAKVAELTRRLALLNKKG